MVSTALQREGLSVPVAQLGLNFSPRQASLLGLSTSEVFYAILIHLRPPHLRLSLYWDEISPEPGHYDFTSIRWLLDRAQDSGCRVLLTVGFKPQRHPSYHPPGWLRAAGQRASQDPPGEERLAANLLMMLERAIALLADYDAVDSWEVENAPFLPLSEQPEGWRMRRALVLREIDVLRDVDPRHRPIIVSHPAGRFFDRGWQTALAAADALGWEWALASTKALPSARLFGSPRWSYLAWRLRLQTWIAAKTGTPCWVTELGTEPPNAARGGNLTQCRLIRDAIALARGSGAERCYLLGAEAWFAVRGQGVDGPWELARSMLRPVGGGSD